MKEMKIHQAEAFCPYYHHAVELIGRRWTGAILRAMLVGVSRFGDLTEKGRSLWSVVEAVSGWAEEWLARPRQGGSDAEAHPPAPLKASR